MPNIRNILIVDDSKTEQIYLSEILNSEGFHCQLANDGEDALAKMAQSAPDLILLDVVMPGQSGFQLTRSFNRDPAYAHIPIILCTSKDQATDRMWGLRQGARDYLVKPVQKEALMSAIAAAAN
jgi:twitching motility two-component system response regulator PilH